ncbi:MAG: single-stranded DNA-binding protein [Spirochaetales bacterium]|nr:single-stranded DNA-binding protein [Spirochaetales bacterium]
MNRIILHGTICKDAEVFSVYGENTPLVSFVVKDYGKPGTFNEEPLTIQVHFKKDVGLRLVPELVKGREVNLYGSITQKNYVTTSNEFKSKIYMIADYIEFVGKHKSCLGECA